MIFLDRMKSLFRAAKKHQVKAKRRLLLHVDAQLDALANDLEQRIEEKISRKYGTINSVFEYVIKDIDGSELLTQWKDKDYITKQEIELTGGYIRVLEKSNSLGLNFKFIEREAIEDFDSESRRGFVVKITGWS